MKKIFSYASIFILASLPLWMIQLIGILVGKIFHIIKKDPKKILVNNITQSGIYDSDITIKAAIETNIRETGKTIMESLAIWASSQSRVLGWIKKIHNEEVIKNALKKSQGIIFLTPHMGCYEITSLYYGFRNPITVLYRPARKDWINQFMMKGRTKGIVKLAPTDKSGIRLIIQALKKGEAVGILPDQAANKGEGEWADFFGRPAYTMVLVSRLAKKTGATVIMAYGQRLDFGQGFAIHLKEIETKNIDSPLGLNLELEKQIRNKPTQYLWNYDKHKGYLDCTQDHVRKN